MRGSDCCYSTCSSRAADSSGCPDPSGAGITLVSAADVSVDRFAEGSHCKGDGSSPPSTQRCAHGD